LARFDPASSSWKTAQQSLLEDSELCSVTWPRSGMTAGGQCYPLPMLGRRMKGSDFGFWQTPVADDACNRKAGKWNSRGEPKLSAQVLWPTPTVCGNYNRKGASATSGDGLATAVRMWPTPTAHNAKETGAPSQMARDTVQLGDLMGGSINPNWVEWLMGWPIGHTDLKPSETGKCLSVHLPPFVSLNQCSERVQA
jgi:hypothetical protein